MEGALLATKERPMAGESPAPATERLESIPGPSCREILVRSVGCTLDIGRSW